MRALAHLWRLEGIVSWEVNIQEKNTSLVWGACESGTPGSVMGHPEGVLTKLTPRTRGPHDGGDPFVYVVSFWAS